MLKKLTIRKSIQLFCLLILIITAALPIIAFRHGQDTVKRKISDGEALIADQIRETSEKSTADIAKGIYRMCELTRENMKNTKAKLTDEQVVEKREKLKDTILANLRTQIINTKVGKSGYVFVLSGKGDDRGLYLISSGGKRDGDNIYKAQDKNNKIFFIKELVKKATSHGNDPSVAKGTIPIDYQEYFWDNKGKIEKKVSAIAYFEPWDWVIGAGAYESDFAAKKAELQDGNAEIQNALDTTLRNTVLVTILFLAICQVIAFFFAKSISKPIVNTSNILKDIAEGEGNLTIRLDNEGTNEVGILSTNFNSFVDKLRQMIASIISDSNALATTGIDLVTKSESMSSEAQEMNLHSSEIAAAVEQLSTNLSSIASGSEHTSSNINTVAAAVEEMSVSLSEVAKNCAIGAQMSSEANDKSRSAGETMSSLNTSAEEIGSVVETISSIADQTNLLALNATIEAASAGDAGKGFAVVANEVKELAKQTAQATEEIGQLITDMLGRAGEAVCATNSVSETIDNLNVTVQTIASAVEEQSATTNEIARSVDNASQTAVEISKNLQEASLGSDEISKSIQTISSKAASVQSKANETNSDSTNIGNKTSNLLDVTSKFKI